jgi:integrase
MPRRCSEPKLRPHKSGQARAIFDGVTKYFGRWGLPETEERFKSYLKDWQIQKAKKEFSPPPGCSIKELIAAFMLHADDWYRREDGSATTEIRCYRWSLRPLLDGFGDLCVDDFKPSHLKEIRQRQIDAGISLGIINQNIGRIRRVFRWGVGDAPGDGLVPTETLGGLESVRDLVPGRNQARETPPVQAADEDSFWAILPYLRPQLKALLELMYWSGMRPGEACLLKGSHIDFEGRDALGIPHVGLWSYRVRAKMAHSKNPLKKWHYYFLGPDAQELLKPWLRANPDEYLFQPREAMEVHRKQLRVQRKSKVPPSQQNRRVQQPKRGAGDHYLATSVAHAVRKAVRLANEDRHDVGLPPVIPWHPHCLRHNAEQRVEKYSGHGVEGGRAVLGHESVNTTKIYASRDMALAADIMRRLG